MELGGPSASEPAERNHKLAELLGTMIAIVTLTLPVFVIAHFSPTRPRVDLLQSVPYHPPQLRE